METLNENDIDLKIKSLMKRLKTGYESDSNETRSSNCVEYFVYLKETKKQSTSSVSLSQLRMILMTSFLANLSKTKLFLFLF